MGSHRPKNPRYPRRRTGGRHTSLLGGTDDDSGFIGDGPPPGDPFLTNPAFSESRTSLLGGTGYDSGFTDDGATYAGAARDTPGPRPLEETDPAYGGSRTSLVGGYAPEAYASTDGAGNEYAPASPYAAEDDQYAQYPGLSTGDGEHYVQGDWPRVWHGEYRPAGHPEDTVVLGDFGRSDGQWLAGQGTLTSDPGEFDRIGQGVSDSLVQGQGNGGPPDAPWYRSPRRLALAAGGLALVAFAGFLVVPTMLSHLGVTGSGPHSALCPACQFPIPSSSPAPATPAPTMTRPKPRSTRAPAAATQPTTPPQNPAPTTSLPPTAAGLAVSYTETPQGQGGFLGQVTVVNHNLTTISGWQLVVALPFDNVSRVTNAQGSDQDDVLFLQPAASDPSIPPGGTLVVTITASGPTTIPEECSFNSVACRLTDAA